MVGKDIPNERLYSAWLPKQASEASVRATEPFDGLPGQVTSYQVKQADGTTSEVDGPYVTYFPVGKEDPFVLIRCEINPHPVTWCVYQVRPNDLVKLEIKMSDFRVYGGRHFVQERLKMILDAYCDYDLSCRP